MYKSRRRFIAGIAATAVTSSGCCLFRRPATIQCLNTPLYSDGSEPLVIDVHAHVFNGSDLPVKEFFNLVICRRVDDFQSVCALFGGILEKIAWSAAPTAQEELIELEQFEAIDDICETSSFDTKIARLRNCAYEAARAELITEAEAQLTAKGLSARIVLQKQIGMPDVSDFAAFLLTQLPEKRSDYEKGDFLDEISLLNLTTLKISAFSAIDFVLEMFQYRIASVSRYFYDYGRDTPKIDLITPSLVDFNWPLAKGNETPSPLSDQFKVMKKIAILTGGRVHPIVPFDPHREVAHRLGRSTFSSLSFVQAAVMSGLAVGVKLYPPMGFAPIGNKGFDNSFWDRSWASDIVHEDNFNRMLDDALGDLYGWCESNTVPLISHSNRSNGPTEDFEDLVSPEGWSEALGEFPELAINFAHLGGVGSSGDDVDWRAYLALMNDSETGARAYADASYFAQALEDSENAVVALLVKLIKQQPLVGKRLTYGSDWKMLALESGAKQYLNVFYRAAERIGASVDTESTSGAFSDDFLGNNSGDWLGLTEAGGNRARMLNFYRKNGMAAPPWVDKTTWAT